MTEQSDGGIDGPQLTLDAFPDQALSAAGIDSLRDGDAIDVVAPIVVDKETRRVTHLDLAVGDTYYFVGWNPTTGRWERILTVADEGDDSLRVVAAPALDEADGAADGESGPDGAGGPEPLPDDPDVEDVTAFVWAHVESTYPDTDRLLDVMDETLAEMAADDE